MYLIMDTFGHIRMVIGFILSLSIARLLVGAVKLIQHPGRTKPYLVHLLWAFYIFLLLTHFWWWEFKLKTTVQEWQFQEYFFIIVFITMYFTLCALLFPDDLKDYQAQRRQPRDERSPAEGCGRSPTRRNKGRRSDEVRMVAMRPTSIREENGSSGYWPPALWPMSSIPP